MLEKIVEFFKTKIVQVNAQPSIKVSFHTYHTEVDKALKKIWEDLLLSLEPAAIRSRKWLNVSEDRFEIIEAEIDGVAMKLEGAKYPNPDYSPSPRDPRTDEQRANDLVDELMRGTNILWVLERCSTRKYRAFIEFLDSSRTPKYEHY